MKKTFLLLFALTLFSKVYAQNLKEEFSLKIKEQYSWLTGTIVENLVDLNLSESLMKAVVENEKFPNGVKQFHSLGNSMMECHDYLYEPKLAGRCDAYSYPSADMKIDCEKETIALKNKVKVSVNAQKIKFTETSYRLLMGYITAVDGFMTKNSSNYGFSRDWRPKTNELHFIIELSELAKDIKVDWSPDGKTAKVTGPAYIEVNEWDTKIGKGLERGGKK
jgi:hypothetical protein